jgi:hypothetical protein
LEALDLFSDLGHFEVIPAIMHGMIVPSLEQRNYKLFGNMLCCQLLVLNQLDPRVAGSIVPIVVDGMKSACQFDREEEAQSVLDALELAWRLGSALDSADEAKLSDHFRFTLDIVVTFATWLTGKSDMATKRAHDLDSASGGVLGLEEWIRKHPPPSS